MLLHPTGLLPPGIFILYSIKISSFISLWFPLSNLLQVARLHWLLINQGLSLFGQAFQLPFCHSALNPLPFSWINPLGLLPLQLVSTWAQLKKYPQTDRCLYRFWVFSLHWTLSAAWYCGPLSSGLLGQASSWPLHSQEVPDPLPPRGKVTISISFNSLPLSALCEASHLSLFVSSERKGGYLKPVGHPSPISPFSSPSPTYPLPPLLHARPTLDTDTSVFVQKHTHISPPWNQPITLGFLTWALGFTESLAWKHMQHLVPMEDTCQYFIMGDSWPKNAWLPMNVPQFFFKLSISFSLWLQSQDFLESL